MKSRYAQNTRDQKKIRFIVTFLVIFFAQGNTQDYQSVRSDRVPYFEDSQHIVKCIKIDSVEQLSVHDSVFYLFPNLQEDMNGCTFEGPSWMGSQIIVQGNGHNLFFNGKHDTILIQTQAIKNASWKAFQFEDSSYVMAEVTDHNVLSFLGQTDSVKTITFGHYNKQNELVDHALNGMTLQLSKHYGLIKTLNFKLFPESETTMFHELDLIGLSKPKMGVNNLTWLDVHDYQMGDVLHIEQEFFSYLPYCADG